MADSISVPNGVCKQDGRWERQCPTCSKTVSHLRKSYCVGAHNAGQPCKACSNKTNHPAGMHGPVRMAWYNRFRASAVTRGYCWDITVDDIASLYEIQRGRCALTGWSVSWSSVGWDHTASIDRIDNNLGYTLENIQLVHKDVNMARGTMGVEDFIEMCQAVAQNSKVPTFGL